ncbi:MAG: DNA translocase FtsK 4TM domain-containing protein [Cryomorphaceae bacterium]
MSYSNHYKSKVDASSGKKKDKQKKERKGIKLSGGNFDGLRGFFEDDRTQNVLGLFFILLSGILLMSLTSYLFTWRIDQDELFDLSWWNLWQNAEIRTENWLGTFGALLSHQLINNGFGVSSFALVLISFLIGFRILFKVELLPFWKTTGHATFFMVWVSIFLGALFTEDYLFLGGAFGYNTNVWLSGLFGTVGAFTIIFFSLLVYAIVFLKVSITDLIAAFNIKKGDDEAALAEIPMDEEEESSEDVEASSVLDFDDDEDKGAEENSEASEEAEDPIDLEMEVAEVESTDAPEPTSDVSEELSTEVPPAEEKDADGPDVDFAVEEATGDEELSEEEKKPDEELADYDPLLDLSRYQYPPIEMLEDHGDGNIQVERDELERNKNNIVTTLNNYNIGISKIKATIGPTVTLYEIIPEAGVRISKIKNLEDDIALSLSALGIRIIAPIPGKGTIGIEVPNQTPDVVSMRTVIKSEKFEHAKMELPIALGKTISNETFVVDLAKMPHLLMAGATGQGKSVGLNCILASLLYKKHPAQVKFVLVDPKKVELTLFNKIERHFLAKLPEEEEAIITDTSKVVNTLNSLCIEMDDRYELLKNAQCRNIKEYNAKFVKRKLNPNDGHRYLPYIVLVVDEFADLIMTAGKEVETPIARLAQLARAIGIHLIIATQRPSVNIITGTIKANFPSRIAFRVTSKIDSRTILDTGGAEQLIGRGDMLYSNGNDLIRLQCAFVDTPEVEKITEFIGNQQGYPDAHLLPEYVPEGSEGGVGGYDDMDRDDLFEDAAHVVVLHQQGSASLLQRKLKLGYNRAGRIVDQLESAGIIGPFEGSKARQVLIPDEVSLEQHLSNLKNKSE